MPQNVTANIAGQGLARVEWEGDRIGSVRVVGESDPAKPFLSTGLIDLQINGFAGVDFSDPDLDVEKLASVLPALWKTGVTGICATLATNTIESLESSFRLFEEARKRDRRFRVTVPCYHLEGPYLSPGEAHGAHDPGLMHPPDWEEFARLQRAAGGNIAIVTLAPELPGACDFIRRATAEGVIAAIGHTDGTPDQIHRAIDAGAQMSTHLGNGCANLMHRHQNPIWPQIASDRLQAGLICDGFHLPEDFVRVVYRAKGIARCILVTDAIHAATMPPGRYSFIGSEIDVLPSGQALRADRKSMAGSTVSMNRAIHLFEQFSGASLAESIQAATENPAKLLKRAVVPSSLSPGQPANLVAFRPGTDALAIESVWLDGDLVYVSGNVSGNQI